jgi:zinc transporter ZupT
VRGAAEARARRAGRARVGLWLAAASPLVLLALLLVAIVRTGPADALRGEGVPPVERLAFQRVELGPDGITATILNDGPDPVTIAQVQVDDAYWSFTADRGTTLERLGRTTLRIPYPWVQGEAHTIRVVTSTGATFEHEIGVAVATPKPNLRFLAIFTLIGIYVGVLPVAIGLLWYPFVARLGRSGLDFLLALTVGLLVFLLVDSLHEGVEAAGAMPESYQGIALLVFGALGAYLVLEGVGAWLLGGHGGEAPAGRRGRAWALALLVALGIGLHNFGEGLAIGAAFALGEAALGTLLIVGFTLHNTTEGLAIVAPLARERPRVRDLVWLGVVGGVPTIGGAWLGGLLYSPFWSVLFLAIGAGAIAQVSLQIARQMSAGEPLARFFTRRPVLAGLAAGFVIMYSTGMLLG